MVRIRKRREVGVDEVGVVAARAPRRSRSARPPDGVERFGVRLVAAARASLEAHDRVERAALLVEPAVHEAHVVVVVGVLDERLPVDRVLLVELAVVPGEVLEPVAVVAVGERGDPLTNLGARCDRQPNTSLSQATSIRIGTRPYSSRSMPSGYMRTRSGMPTSRPSRSYVQLWYGHVIVEPQLPAGSNSTPEARCRQLFRNPLTSPSAVRTTSTGCAPIRPVM